MAFDARAQQWLLTTSDGDVSVSPDLVTWTDAPDMPVSDTAGDRRLVAADIGRRVGWSEDSKDTYHRDAGQPWAVSYSLTRSISEIVEVK